MSVSEPRSEGGARIDWDIRNEGRSWRAGEAMERYFLGPEKLEMVNGKLLWSDEDRETLLGSLPENVAALGKLDISPIARD
jgi:hypothetical protein